MNCRITYLQRTFFTSFLILLSVSSLHAQTKAIETYKKQIPLARNNSQRLSTMLQLCDQYRSMHPDTLSYYLVQAKKLIVISGTAEEKAQADFYEVILLNRGGFTDSALALVGKYLAMKNGAISQKLWINFNLVRCNLLIRNDRIKEAIENALSLLHSAELAKDHFTVMRAQTVIGWANMELGKNRESLDWSFAALKTHDTYDTTMLISVVYNNIAAVYNELDKNDSAEYYVKKGISYSEKEQNLTYLTNGYYIYSDICVALHHINKAEDLLKKGLEIRKQIGDVFYIVSDLAQLGVFYANNNQPQKGIDAVKEGIALAEKNQLSSKLPFLYSALAKNYKVSGDLVNYSNTLNTIITLKDSLYERNSADALAEMQTKYDVQKKENIIIQQKYDLTQKNIMFYGVAGLLAATLLFGYFYLQNRRKAQQIKMQALEMEEKKKTTKAVMQAEEEERKRIAGDLHDSVAQKMVVAKLNLEVLGNHLDNINEKDQQIFDNIATLLEESTTEVRNLSHSMMPKSFAVSGLTMAVKEFLDKIRKTNFRVNFSVEGNFEPISEANALMIYRIIQECVVNVLKHASASRLDVSMIAEQNEIDVMIEDDGIGFNINEQEAAAGIGMKNIRSRIEYLSGRLDITSNKNQGTLIAFYIPFHH